jgi:hypothetical protein
MYTVNNQSVMIRLFIQPLLIRPRVRDSGSKLIFVVLLVLLYLAADDNTGDH